MTPRGDVCMFLATPLRHDTRVEKEAASLVAAGYRVRIIASHHPGLPREEQRAGATVVRVDEDPLPARVVRTALRLRAGRRSAPAGDPGTVITREAVERPGARAAVLSRALRLHLELARRRYTRMALREAARHPAALWIAHDLETLPAALAARERLGGRVLYDSHELFVESTLARGARRRWERLERRAIRQADAVTTVSESIARELAQRYSIAQPEVVLNAPPAPAADDGEPVDLRRALDLPAGVRVVLYIGGIQQGRGLEQVAEAVGTREDLAFVMLGPGTPSYRASLERLVDGTAGAERIRFVPPVEPSQIRRHARGADVGISALQGTLLSNRYSLGNKLFDYLHAGLPLVVSDLPEMRALVERHDVGTVCDPTSPASIADAIDRVTLDRARHEQLRRNAAATAPLYTWERQEQKLLALVERLT